MDALRELGIEDPRRGRTRRRVFIVVAVLAVPLVGYLWKLRHPTRPPAYETARVARGELVATVSATGSLRPVRTVDVGAEVSGRVVAVHVDVNDRVRAGQVLVEIDTLSASASAEQRRASVLEAGASVELARIAREQATVDLDRTRSLHERGIASAQQLEQAEAAAERAEAEVRAASARSSLARAGLREASAVLERAVIRSPIDGVVLTRAVQPGQTVAATLSAPTLLQLAESLEHMELHVDVDEADVGRVHENMRATFVVDAYADRRFEGRIVRVAYAGRLVQNVVSYETVIAVENPDLALRPAMTANATIVTDVRRGVLLVPSAALRYAPRASARIGRDRRWDAPRGPMLYTLVDGAPSGISVEIFGSDETRTEVRGEGLREGLTVILADPPEAP